MLSEKYDPNEIYIFATDTDRSLMSAAANLAALYPPIGEEIWQPSIYWQPIPIHSIPRPLDGVLAVKRPCEAFNYHYTNLFRTKEFLLMQPRFQAIYKYLTEHTGETTDDVYAVRKIYDTLLVQTFYNKT